MQCQACGEQGVSERAPITAEEVPAEGPNDTSEPELGATPPAGALTDLPVAEPEEAPVDSEAGIITDPRELADDEIAVDSRDIFTEATPRPKLSDPPADDTSKTSVTEAADPAAVEESAPKKVVPSIFALPSEPAFSEPAFDVAASDAPMSDAPRLSVLTAYLRAPKPPRLPKLSNDEILAAFGGSSGGDGLRLAPPRASDLRQLAPPPPEPEPTPEPLPSPPTEESEAETTPTPPTGLTLAQPDGGKGLRSQARRPALIATLSAAAATLVVAAAWLGTKTDASGPDQRQPTVGSSSSSPTGTDPSMKGGPESAPRTPVPQAAAAEPPPDDAPASALVARSSRAEGLRGTSSSARARQPGAGPALTVPASRGAPPEPRSPSGTALRGDKKPPAAAPPAVQGPAFDVGAARAALASAAGQASSCRRGADPSGTATVTVTFSPSGRVTSANISGPPFAGTPTGGCIASAMRRAVVPPFAGDHKTVSKRVVIR